MDEHPAIAEDRIQAEAVGRRHREELERARHDSEDEEKEGKDRGEDPRGVRGDPLAEARAREERGGAQHAEDQRPVEQRAFLAAVEARRDERDRRRQVAVLGDVGKREIAREQRRFKQPRRQHGHPGSRVERPACDLGEDRALARAGPEGEQSRESAKHEPGEQGAGAEVAENHDV